MITYNDIIKLFSFDLKCKFCIEIEFSVKNHPKYLSCWMGKMPDKNDKERELYWYGLTADGSESYDFYNFEDFACATVFDGKSLEQIFSSIEINSIDGCDPTERLQTYIRDFI